MQTPFCGEVVFESQIPSSTSPQPDVCYQHHDSNGVWAKHHWKNLVWLKHNVFSQTFKHHVFVEFCLNSETSKHKDGLGLESDYIEERKNKRLWKSLSFAFLCKVEIVHRLHPSVNTNQFCSRKNNFCALFFPPCPKIIFNGPLVGSQLCRYLLSTLNSKDISSFKLLDSDILVILVICVGCIPKCKCKLGSSQQKTLWSRTR